MCLDKTETVMGSTVIKFLGVTRSLGVIRIDVLHLCGRKLESDLLSLSDIGSKKTAWSSTLSIMMIQRPFASLQGQSKTKFIRFSLASFLPGMSTNVAILL